MSVRLDSSRLYSGFFDTLTAENSKDSFSKRYSRFKKRCHCRSLNQVIGISKEHLDRVDDVEDLKKVLEGLSVVREKYPQSGRWKNIMRIFNANYRKSEAGTLKNLDLTIEAYSSKIDDLSKIQSNRKEAPIEAILFQNFCQIASSQENMYEKVQQLLGDSEFCHKAEETVRRMSEVSSLPAHETIRIWGAEMGNLVKVVDKTFTAADVYLAMLLVGRKFTPLLVRRMEKLKENDPGIVYPVISKHTLEASSSVFRYLANSVNIALGEAQAKQIDLLSERYKDAQYDVFSNNDVSKEINSFLSYRPGLMMDIRLLIVQMGADYSESTPEVALVNLKNGIRALLEDKAASSFDEQDRIDVELYLTSDSLDYIVDAVVVKMAREGGEDLFSAFVLLFETSLKHADVHRLDDQSLLVATSFVRSFNHYAEVDMIDALTGSHSNQSVGTPDAIASVNEDVQIVEDDSALTRQMELGHSIAIDVLKKNKEFEQFAEEIQGVADISDFNPFVENLLMNQSDFNFISSAFLAMTGYSIVENADIIDQREIQQIMYVLFEKNPKAFSLLVTRLSAIKPEELISNKEFYENLCRAADFVSGTDPRNMKIEDGQTLYSQKVRKEIDVELLDRNMRLFLVQNEWLAGVDEKNPPEGVEKSIIVDAKNIQRMVVNEHFKGDVESLLSDYCSLGQHLGTHIRRWYFNQMIEKLIDSYKDQFYPTKETFDEDDFFPFLQAILTVNPEKGNEFLCAMAQEDSVVLERVRSNSDWLCYSMYNFVDYFSDDNKFMMDAFGKAQTPDNTISVEKNNPIGTDTTDLEL